MQIVGHRCMHFDHWLIFLWADYEFACYHERLYRSHVARSLNKVNGWKLIRASYDNMIVIVWGTRFSSTSRHSLRMQLFTIPHPLLLQNHPPWTLVVILMFEHCTVYVHTTILFLPSLLYRTRDSVSFFSGQRICWCYQFSFVIPFFSAEPAELWAFARNTQIACIYRQQQQMASRRSVGNLLLARSFSENNQRVSN